MEIYVVQRGDTAWAIARRFDVPLERLIADNQLGEEAALTVGQALLIRGEERERERRPALSVGYAYPFIQQGGSGGDPDIPHGRLCIFLAV